MKRIYDIQAVIHLIVGIGAMAGGIMAIIDPYGILFGMQVDAMRKGPFTSFLIPGLFLLLVIGLGHLIAFWAVKHKLKLHGYLGGGLGCILMAWILIQCYILESIHYLHIIFFVVGLIESVIALYMLTKLKLFPFSKGVFRLY